MKSETKKGSGEASERLERIATDLLIPYARNARTHSEQQVAQIAGSIQEFGFCNPVLIDAQNGIIAGHGRVLAAQKLKLETVPCIRLGHLTDAQKRAYILADNRIALSSGWDEAMLANELSDLHADDFDMALLGFDADELANLLKLSDAEQQPAGEIVEDEVPEPPVDPITKAGDLWLLGDHRLLCGDSTKAEDVGRLMAGQKVDLLLTDPPYNVALGNETVEQAKKRNRRTDGKKVTNDSLPDADFRNFVHCCFQNAFAVMKPGAAFYVWHADRQVLPFLLALEALGQQMRQCVVWVKSSLVMGRQDYQSRHEPCLYGWKDGAAHGWYSDRKQTTILEFNKPHRSEDHPTMKPVALFAYQIGNSTAPQGSIYDSFLGSGTTLIAAEQLNRKCYGMEISPQYCDVIVKRWENPTGKKAVLEAV